MTKQLPPYFPVILDHHPVTREPMKLIMDIAKEAVGDNDMAPELIDMMRASDAFQTMADMSARYSSEHGYTERRHRYQGMVVADAGVQQYWHHYRWTRCGREVYDLDANLVRAFAETDIRVNGDDVQLPVPTFYIAIPESLRMPVKNRETGEHILNGFYISECSIGVDSTLLQPGDPREFLRALAICAVGTSKDPDQPEDNALAVLTLPLSFTGSYETWIDEFMEKDSKLAAMSDQVEYLRGWIRIVINTILYLTSEDRDVEKQRIGPSSELRKRAKAMPSKQGKRALDAATLDVRYFKVGARYKPSRELLEYSDASRTTRHILSRFMVRGHWRMQAHGEKRQLRKRTWIAPFWKGAPWAEVAATIHVRTVEG